MDNFDDLDDLDDLEGLDDLEDMDDLEAALHPAGRVPPQFMKDRRSH